MKRSVLLGFVVAAGALAPLRAQQPAPTPAPDQQQAQQQTKFQIQIFESVLQRAVRNGGMKFAKEHSDFIPPGVQLTTENAQVIALSPPEGGNLVFYVQVPEIREVVLSEMIIQRGPSTRTRPDDPVRSTANTGRGQSPRVQAAGLPEADPMAISPVVENGSCASRVKPSRGYIDPDYDYAVAVCDALIDALLENSGPLGVKENEWLTIAAVSEPDRLSVITSSKKIYLQIKGADLQAMREGRLTKDETRRRVVLKLD